MLSLVGTTHSLLNSRVERSSQVTKYTLWTYLITIFSAGIMVIAEGMFYSLVTMDSLDTTHLGVYQKLRKVYGRSKIPFVPVAIDD